MTSIAHRIVGDAVVLVHSALAPTDSEWGGLLAEIEKLEDVRLVVFTDRATPSSEQRDRLRDELAGRPVSIVLFSRMLHVEGPVRAWRFEGASVRRFFPRFHIQEGLGALAIVEQAPILRAALDLRRGLEGRDPQSALLPHEVHSALIQPFHRSVDEA